MSASLAGSAQGSFWGFLTRFSNPIARRVASLCGIRAEGSASHTVTLAACWEP